METFLNHLFGESTGAQYLASLVWILISIAGVKLFYYPAGIKFKFLKWVNENLKDVLLGIIVSFGVLRLGEWGISFVESKFALDLPEATDMISVIIIVTVLIQIKLHKERKPIVKTDNDHIGGGGVKDDGDQ